MTVYAHAFDPLFKERVSMCMYFNDARKECSEHCRLVFSVRDSVARLPNGEGTRGDICELLKDSQFLAPGITDAQVGIELR